jgi:hypothetical protein
LGASVFVKRKPVSKPQKKQPQPEALKMTRAKFEGTLRKLLSTAAPANKKPHGAELP